MEITEDWEHHPLENALLNRQDGSGLDSVAARFCVDGATCVVVSLSRLNQERDFRKQLEQSVLNGRIAGTLLVNNEQYLVCTVDESVQQVSNGPRQQLLSDVLTRRELQVASLVAEGKVNKQIAYMLGISEWTVSTHIRRTFAKLGVRSRAAMAAHVAAYFNGMTHD